MSDGDTSSSGATDPELKNIADLFNLETVVLNDLVVIRKAIVKAIRAARETGATWEQISQVAQRSWQSVRERAGRAGID